MRCESPFPLQQVEAPISYAIGNGGDRIADRNFAILQVKSFPPPLLWVEYKGLLEVLNIPQNCQYYVDSKYIFTYTGDVLINTSTLKLRSVQIPLEIKQCASDMNGCH